ncbi:MAG TPA: hypothetical protein DCQ93_09860, partial [Bacteroidetes bacterium]|nr:hypothetical protein [Bacteroidota bacterium]
MKRFIPHPSPIFFLLFLFTFHFSPNTSVAQDIDISNGNVFDGEPYIAVNPTNTQNMVIAWMGFVFNSGTGLT